MAADGNGPFGEFLPLAPPPIRPLSVPVFAVGPMLLDAKHMTIANCPNAELAAQLAFIINAHAGTL